MGDPKFAEGQGIPAEEVQEVAVEQTDSAVKPAEPHEPTEGTTHSADAEPVEEPGTTQEEDPNN